MKTYYGREVINWGDGETTSIEIEVPPEVVEQIERNAIRRYRRQLRTAKNTRSRQYAKAS